MGKDLHVQRPDGGDLSLKLSKEEGGAVVATDPDMPPAGRGLGQWWQPLPREAITSSLGTEAAFRNALAPE